MSCGVCNAPMVKSYLGEPVCLQCGWTETFDVGPWDSTDGLAWFLQSPLFHARMEVGE